MLYFKLNINIKYFISNFSFLLFLIFIELFKKGFFFVFISIYCIYECRYLKIYNRVVNIIFGIINGKLYGLSNYIMCLYFYEFFFMKM